MRQQRRRELYGAVVDTNGGVVFLETDNGTVNVLDRQDKLGLPVTEGAYKSLGVECHADGSGEMSMVVGLSNTGPSAVYRMDTGGPTSFDIMGMYAEAESDGYTVAVNEAGALGVGSGDGTMSDGAQTLLAHIPTDLQNGCYESPIPTRLSHRLVHSADERQRRGARALHAVCRR